MNVTVTTTDHDTGDTETMQLAGHRYLLVVNEADGYYVAGEQVYANGTSVVTIKRTSSEEG